MDALDPFTHAGEPRSGIANDDNVAISGLAISNSRSAAISTMNETTTKDPSVGVRLVLEHQTKALRSGGEVVKFAKSVADSPPPIVPTDEIQAAKDLFPDRVHGSKILQLPDSKILKVGRDVGVGEAEAICLVSRRTGVPVPQVHNAYMVGDVGYILMDKVPGTPLTDYWDKMSDEEQGSIVEQLRKYVNEMRNIEGEFIGSVDGGPCDEVLFKHTWGPASPTYGPFWSRQDFNKGVAAALRKSRPEKVFTEADSVLEAEILASGSGSDEKMVLTHGDLSRGNIMVREGMVIGIVDWGAAGYSIPEMEYFSAKLTSDETSWDTAIESFIPVYEKECAFWRKVNNQMAVYTGI